MIRVLRLIEYTYPDAQRAEEDMSNWKVPSIGSYSPGNRKMIRSTILTNLNFEPEDNNGPN